MTVPLARRIVERTIPALRNALTAVVDGLADKRAAVVAHERKASDELGVDVSGSPAITQIDAQIRVCQETIERLSKIVPGDDASLVRPRLETAIKFVLEHAE